MRYRWRRKIIKSIHETGPDSYIQKYIRIEAIWDLWVYSFLNVLLNIIFLAIFRVHIAHLDSLVYFSAVYFQDFFLFMV